MVIHFQKLICPIDASQFVNESIEFPYRVELSISNNGDSFSSPKELIVHHSTCWNCSIYDGCVQVQILKFVAMYTHVLKVYSLIKH